MLELKHISWELPDGKRLLNNVSLKAENGKLVVITGPNGGGKTSLAKIVAGLEQPSGGQILLDGIDVTQKTITERARLGIAYAFQQPVRFKGLTVRDLLEMAKGGIMEEDEICTCLSEVGLCARDYMDREVNSSLSGGEVKRIEIASVLVRQAPFTLFDEPEAGIDIWSFQSLIQVLDRLRQQTQGALMIISHQERIFEIADEIVVISNGKITRQGPRDEMLPQLKSNPGYCPVCPGKGGRAYE